MSFVYQRSYGNYGMNQYWSDAGSALATGTWQYMANVSGNGQALHFRVQGNCDFVMAVDLDGANVHDLSMEHPAGHISLYGSCGEHHQYLMSRYDTVANKYLMEMIKPGHFEGKYRTSLLAAFKQDTGSSKKLFGCIDYVTDATGCRLFKVKGGKIEDPAAVRAELVEKLSIPKREVSVGWNVRWDEKAGVNVIDSFVFVGDAPADVETGIHKGIRNALGELLQKDVDETEL